MPKKKPKRKQPTQTQKQRQSVVVNIGSISKSKPRKSSGRGPPPSYRHNLAPTFITAPQVDYTPLLAMLQHTARPIVEQAPMANTQTPLSSTIQASNAERMAGEAAIRRAGKTASNFQPPPSQADERFAKQVQDYDDELVKKAFEEKRKRSPIVPDYAGGGGLPIAESRPKKGRPKKDTQVATPVGQAPAQAQAQVRQGPRQETIFDAFKRAGLL